MTASITVLNDQDVYRRMMTGVSKTYKCGARKFVEFMKARDNGLDYEGLLEYVESLNGETDGRRYAFKTINYYIDAALNRVRAIPNDSEASMTTAERYRIEKALKEIKRKKIVRKPVERKRCLEMDSEVPKFLQECPDERVRCWFLFLASTGCRVSEMLGILKSDLADDGPDHLEIRIRGKNDKERFRRIRRDMIERIQTCFQGRKYLFESPYLGKNGKLVPYTREYVSHRITAHGKKILGRHITAHTLRHTYATYYLDSGKPIKAVQLALGHSSASTTMDMYWHPEPLDAEDDMLQANLNQADLWTSGAAP